MSRQGSLSVLRAPFSWPPGRRASTLRMPVGPRGLASQPTTLKEQRLFRSCATDAGAGRMDWARNRAPDPAESQVRGRPGCRKIPVGIELVGTCNVQGWSTSLETERSCSASTRTRPSSWASAPSAASLTSPISACCGGQRQRGVTSRPFSRLGRAVCDPALL
jgi:hypothetical protein